MSANSKLGFCFVETLFGVFVLNQWGSEAFLREVNGNKLQIKACKDHSRSHHAFDKSIKDTFFYDACIATNNLFHEVASYH